MDSDWWRDHGPVHTCPACGGDYYRNEMERVGLIMYCRYCLDNDMVPGGRAGDAIESLPDICWACGDLGCRECNWPNEKKRVKK